MFVLDRQRCAKKRVNGTMVRRLFLAVLLLCCSASGWAYSATRARRPVAGSSPSTRSSIIIRLSCCVAARQRLCRSTLPCFQDAVLPPSLRTPSFTALQLTNNDDQETQYVNGVEEAESGIGSSGSDSTFSWKYAGKQIRLFQQMALPYYQESKAGRWLLAGVLALTLANSGVSVAFSYLSKDFWNALSAKDSTEFYQVLIKFCGALVVGAPIGTLFRYQREQLAVHWREWMTSRTLDLYAAERVDYNLDRNSDVDNPDQRICQDVDSFTAVSLQLVITVLTSLIDLGSFSAILWSIYPQLFGAIMLYAGIGTLVTAFLGRSLVGLNFAQLSYEADMRYSLVRLRDNAESIAFYSGEGLEGQAVERRMAKVMENQRRINAAQRNLELFTNAYRYLVQIVPVAVVAPKYFAGEIELGVISQSVGAFNHILNDLSIIVNQFERLSSFSAGIDRLSQFYETMREVDTTRTGDDPLLQRANETLRADIAMTNLTAHRTASPYGTIDMRTYVNGDAKTGNILTIEHLDLCTPDQQRLLVKDLCVNLKEGQNLLIVGNSGAGKSSLLRGIAGLWTTGNGVIERPADGDVYFLPQRPYCTVGSLRDQLMYPAIDHIETSNATDTDDGSDNRKVTFRTHLLQEALTDAALLDILEKVDLLPVAARAGKGDARAGLYAVLDWSNLLSLGEQQRLAFGRLLVNKPRLVILDEATAALDPVAEARMYNMLRNMGQRNLNTGSDKSGLSRPRVTYISVGHRPSLVAYHDKRLRLTGEEGYELSDIEKSTMDIASQLANL